jgi:DNA-binding CsgD family transcriptional regulator
MFVSTAQSQVLSRVIATLTTPMQARELRQHLVSDIAILLNADYVASFVWNDAKANFTDGVCCLEDTEHLKRYESHFQYEDPIAPRLRPLREPTRVSQVIPQKELVNTEFYDRFLDTQSMYWGMNVFAHNGFRDLGDLRIWRAKDKHDFSNNEMGMLRLIYPSMVNALSYSIAAEQLDQPIATPVDSIAQQYRLSCREAQVLGLIAQGLADKVIAKQLGIGFTTVRTYVSALLKKTGRENRKALIAFTGRTLFRS